MDCFPTYYYLTRNSLVSFRIRSLEIDRLNHKSFSSLFLDILSLFGSVWLLYSENKVPPQRVDHKSSFAYGTLTFYWKKISMIDMYEDIDLYSLINMRQLHIFSIKPKLDMGLFVDFCVFTWIWLNLPDQWSEPNMFRTISCSNQANSS